eukprot:107967_1
MSTKETSTKWHNLLACPATSFIRIPTGIDKNNYIVIEFDQKDVEMSILTNNVISIYKYNTNTYKWNKITDLNNYGVQHFSATFDATKQILYLFHTNSLTEIQISNNHINNVIYNNTTTELFQNLYNVTSIIINSSVFVFSSGDSAVLNWNSESNTLTKCSWMYNNRKLDDFAIAYNKKDNYVLLFGGFDWNTPGYVDYILEFNINTKKWNKLSVSLPRKM